MSKLHIAPKLSLPIEAETETFAIIGKRGVGKTSTAVVLTEELLKAEQQVVVIDPLDAWWGLRSSADGKAQGFPITVLGGVHGDLPLAEESGAIIADFVVEQQLSVVLSLRHLSKNGQRRFVTNFCGRLYHRKGEPQYRTPLHIMIDEADAFVPQRIFSGQEQMVGAIDDLVRRGRSSGIGVTLITQRAAVIHKDVLTQIEVLVCMRTISPQDRKALETWIEAHDAHDQRGDFMESLASLEKGEAWFWSPGWLGIFQRVQVRMRATFDSSATPKIGERTVKPKQLAPVDLEKLQAAIASTIEKQKAEDPRELRKKIAELQQQLAAKDRGKPAEGKDGKEFERGIEEGRKRALREMAAGKTAREKKLRELIGRGRKKMAAALSAIAAAVSQADTADLDAAIAELGNADVYTPAVPSGPIPGWKPEPRVEYAPPRGVRESRQPAAVPSNGLGAGERQVLIAIAQYPEGADRELIGILTGYKRSTRDAYIQRLAARDYVDVLTDGSVRARSEGVAALGSGFEKLPTGDALLDWWRGRLPEGERKVLDAVIDGNTDREAIGEHTGYKRSTRDAYIQRLATRKLVKLVGRGELAASEALFG